MGALEGIRVLDLSRVLAGPYCTMMLGDLGAEVIKVEMPGSGDDTRRWGPPFVDGESAYYLCANRNKKSITLNLKSEEGKEILAELIERSDILVENFKMGTLEVMGFPYERLRELNPGLIYLSLTGYGPEGPYANRPGYDSIIQAEAGLMSVTGEPEGDPMKVGVAVVDITTGMLAATSILAALHWRDRTGEGQKIDLSLMEGGIALLANVGSNYLVGGEMPGRYGSGHPNIVPYDTFKASDRYMAIAVGNDGQFRRFCEVLGKPEWAQDERFATNAARVENRAVLAPMIGEVFRTRPADEWLAQLERAGIPCGAINTLDKLFSDPQVTARRMVAEVQHPTAGPIKVVAPPYKLSATPASVRLHPPRLGEHTGEVLHNLLSLDESRISELRERGVV